MEGTLTLREARESELDEVRAMFREYEAWLGVSLCFQGFEAELAALPGRYAPPAGRLLLADWSGRLAGVVAMRALEGGACEMKRLFVRDFARGLGVGRLLAERIVDEARRAGYRVMRLDTLPDRMRAANALYDALGFREVPAYYANPLPGVRYMELALA